MTMMFMAGMERVSMKLISAVMIISLGVAMASVGEVNMNLMGLGCMVFSMVAESARLVLTQQLLTGMEVHPLEGLTLISSSCALWLTLQVRGVADDVECQ